MFLEIASNNGTKYIRICESVRVTDPETNKSSPKKKTIKNIGPVSRFDDGKPNFINRLKASYAAGNPIIEELRPFLNSKVPQEVYPLFVRHCLEQEIVISPLYEKPSIVPYGADKGVFRKLERNPFTWE